MITVGMNYEIIEGKETQFEAAFEKVLGAMQSMAGHGQTHLYKEASCPRTYLILSEWEDESAFRAFTSSEQFKNVVDWGKEQILASMPQHQIYGSPS